MRIGLLGGDDLDVVGREPAALVVEETIPPTGLEAGENLYDVLLFEGQRAGVLRLIVVQRAY